MRVALFFDGKNFFYSFRYCFPHIEIDYDKLAQWVSSQAGGPNPDFVGAYYYTGYFEIQQGGSKIFTRFLYNLNLRSGYFVRREPKVKRRSKCNSCGKVHYYRTEKRVDTRLVADMIHYAATDKYDIAVLFSGDQDLVPAVEAVDRLGKRVYVATWKGRGLSRDLRNACFDRIDLALGVPIFQTARVPKAASLASPAAQPAQTTSTPVTIATAFPSRTVSSGPIVGGSSLLAEIRRVQSMMPDVSRWYFENKWTSAVLPPTGSPERLSLVQDAIIDQTVELYSYIDKRGRQTQGLRPKEQTPTN